MVSCLHVMPSNAGAIWSPLHRQTSGKKTHATCFKFQKLKIQKHSKCHMFRIPKIHQKKNSKCHMFRIPKIHQKNRPKFRACHRTTGPPIPNMLRQLWTNNWHDMETENDMQMKCKQKWTEMNEMTCKGTWTEMNRNRIITCKWHEQKWIWCHEWML